MKGGIKAVELSELETIFRDDKHKVERNTIRNRVERYETGIGILTGKPGLSHVKGQEAERLRNEAKKLRGN